MSGYIEYKEGSTLSGFKYDPNRTYEKLEQVKRDPFITEIGLKSMLNGSNMFLNDPEVYELLNSPDVDEDRKSGISTSFKAEYLDLLILKYTIGDPIDEMIPLATRAFKEFDRHYHEYTKMMHTYYPKYIKSEDDSKYSLLGNNDYQYIFWLLSLAYLLGQDEYIPKIATWFSHREQDGRDPLMAAIFARLGCSDIPAGEELLHPMGYSDLWDIINHLENDKAIQSNSMTNYLRGWYQNVIGKTVWKGTDREEKVAIGAYFGLWSFEAALITVLYGLDDKEYRDMTFYPKDLVDYSRSTRELVVSGGGN